MIERDGEEPFASDPVVVAGVGGSGTRVLWKILDQIGFYMGSDVNTAGDNLWFTALFKRPDWLCGASQEDIDQALDLFVTLMTSSRTLSRLETRTLLTASLSAFAGRIHIGAREASFARLEAAQSRPARSLATDRGWGWKEPNSLIWIPHLDRYFARCRIILVVRNGLDMAFSRVNPHRFWSGHLGLRTEAFERQPVWQRKLEYWVAANRYALRTGRALGRRFLIVALESLCTEPEREIERLLGFLDLRLRPETVRSLEELPRTPRSLGRHRERDLTGLSPELRESVRALEDELQHAGKIR